MGVQKNTGSTKWHSIPKRLDSSVFQVEDTSVCLYRLFWGPFEFLPGHPLASYLLFERTNESGFIHL